MSCISTGACCEIVYITSKTRAEFEAMIKKGIEEHGNTDYVFMLENWVPANNEEAIKIRPQLKKWKEESISKAPFYFCSQFNTTTRKCMDYDNRPRVCKKYPYSGLKKLPIADLMLRVSIECGYALGHPDYNKHMEEINGHNNV